MLQVGAAGVLGLTLPRLLQAKERRAEQGISARADSCIIIFLDGGPSHLDMWDMKPQSPTEVRGEFKPIASSVPGIQVSEHLPRLAKVMHHGTLIRSMHHSVNNAHAAAVYCALTGHDAGEKGGGGTKPTDYPAIGSVMTHCWPPRTPMIPFVTLPYITKEGAGGPPQNGFFAGWLGRTYDPLFVLRDPNAAGFSLQELAPPPSGFQDRRQLLGNLEGEGNGQPSPAHREMDAFRAKAFDLLTSPAAQRAFQIDQEPMAVRQRYGRNIYGQSTLLARRLIEAGTRVATISWAPDANATWDTHGNNFTKLKNELLPQLDMAVSSLLTDLSDRGLLERTLVAVMGEFGRSPKINGSGGGRDHWNFCYSLMLAGGGIKPGTVYGSSDSIGGRPRSNPVTPADVIATIYDCLGIPADLELHDRLQRPFQLVPWGTAIRELIV
jgi:hypothetical protein